jgi:hypothetical protein
MTRSSVAPIGIWMICILAVFVGTAPSTLRARHDSHITVIRVGWQRYGQSSTSSTSGRIAAADLTSVDFPVPLGPLKSTPPMLGSIALTISALFSRSLPTMAENG